MVHTGVPNPEQGLAGLTRLRFAAEGTFAQHLVAIRMLAAGRAERCGEPVLFDATSVRFLPTTAEAEAFADLLASREGFGDCRTALVTELGAQFGLARMVCTLAELRGGRAKAFVDERTAATWLRGHPPG